MGFTHRPKQKVIDGELEIAASAGVMSAHGCNTGRGQRKETKERRHKTGTQNIKTLLAERVERTVCANVNNKRLLKVLELNLIYFSRPKLGDGANVPRVKDGLKR